MIYNNQRERGRYRGGEKEREGKREREREGGIASERGTENKREV